ncbi:MAG: LytTR family DNA-binding domain-containing protein [Bacteroidota bacterium]
MNKLTCIAIDDEPLVLNMVRKYAEQIPYLELMATFESGFEAFELIQNQNIDLLLLDINMPDLNGIQFLKSLHQKPLVIFITAYEKYALQGYELDVVDYLLKPYGFDRFLKAINKALELKKVRKQSFPTSEPLPHPNPPLTETKADYIFIKSDYQLLKINFSEIDYIQGYRDYVKIYLDGEKNPILSLQTLKSIESRLDPARFLRAHRSYIIAIDKISRVRNNKVLIGKIEIPIGEYYSEEFYKRVVEGNL